MTDPAIDKPQSGRGAFAFINAIVDGGILAEMPGGAPNVLWALIRHAKWDEEGNGEAYPGVEKLAEESGLHPTNVRRALRWMKERGILVDAGFHEGAKTTIRQLVLPAPVQKCTPRENAPLAKSLGEGERNRSRGESEIAPQTTQSNNTENNTLFASPQEPCKPAAVEPKPEWPKELSAFDRFWEAWPRHERKTDRKGTERKWKSKGCDQIATKVMVGLEWWKRSREWQKNGGEFIPAPTAWLNRCRWESCGVVAEVSLPASTQASRSTVSRQVAEGRCCRRWLTEHKEGLPAMIDRLCPKWPAEDRAEAVKDPTSCGLLMAEVLEMPDVQAAVEAMIGGAK